MVYLISDFHFHQSFLLQALNNMNFFCAHINISLCTAARSPQETS